MMRRGRVKRTRPDQEPCRTHVFGSSTKIALLRLSRRGTRKSTLSESGIHGYGLVCPESRGAKSWESRRAPGPAFKEVTRK
jgi:hypothetical protein